jgi:hypothetical protein
MMNNDIIGVIALVGTLFGLLSIVIHLGAMEIDFYYFTPRTLYRLTKMNWFGCFLVSLLAWIFNPIYCCLLTIGYIISHICDCVCWILHVGRKE